MSDRLLIVSLVIEVIYLLVILGLLKKKKLVLSYSLLWIISGVVLIVFTVCPKLLESMFDLVGVKSPMNGLLSLCIFCILIILISITSIVSKQAHMIRELTQSNALLENRIRELEESVNSGK